MLPEELSNGLCSLKPGQDRLTFSVFMTFDGAGRMVGTQCARTIMHSKLRLTYEQALAVLETPEGMKCREADVSPEVMKLVKDVCSLAMQLRQLRMQKDALNIDLPESQIHIGKDGMIEDIRPVINDVSHQMIEECMVAANEAVDRELSQRGIRLIHRLHEPPAEDKLLLLREELKDMGYQPGDLRPRGSLMQFVRRIKDTPLAHSAQMAILRSMKRAVYSSKEGGHFGLAKKYYAHFTSPIRRYPDLVVHRLLAAALEKKSTQYKPDDLERISLHCSETEQSAEKAERDLLEIKKYRFLLQQLDSGTPLVYESVVVKVANFGLFVELGDLDVQGLVHVSTLSESFVRFDPAAKALRVGTDAYKVGTKVRVFASRVDFEKRRIDFIPAKEQVKDKDNGKRKGDADRRRSGKGRRHRR
jgi:ribonuclease R